MLRTEELQWTDIPDVDAIRVGDTYYMISTTMHMLPGGVILSSKDLLHWDILSYVFDELDGTDGQRLIDGKGVYGKGMWAASLRYHDGTFYVCFVCNDTHKTYLYRSENICGPWRKSTIEGFYHDCSLLFDDDGRKYIVYGNRDIYITELNDEMTAPKKEGLNRQILHDGDEYMLGLEGTHIYKINGKYYTFFIHWPKGGIRQQACYVADSLEGEFTGGNILTDDMGVEGAGVAQGGIIDTPDGKWYSILFQDHGAVGRVPVLAPMHWEDDYPVIDGGDKLKYCLMNVNADDDFEYVPDESGKIILNKVWQWNHQPDATGWMIARKNAESCLRITTNRLSPNIIQAANTLTQRTVGQVSEAEVTVTATDLRDGDYAGISAFQSHYAFIGLTRREGKTYITMLKKSSQSTDAMGTSDQEPGDECESIAIAGDTARLKIVCDFTDRTDKAYCYYYTDGEWKQLGETVQLRYTLDHFMGCRIGLSCYSTKVAGATADFSTFAIKNA